MGVGRIAIEKGRDDKPTGVTSSKRSETFLRTSQPS